MSVRFDESTMSSPETEPVHDARPWHEAGWIITSDGAVTVERQGDRTRVRKARFSHLREG